MLGNQLSPLNVSIPKPIFPSKYLILSLVAGFSMIYHQLRALMNFSAVRNIYLVGKYDSSKFTDFIDRTLSEFDFKSI